jgi:phytoene desaturase
MSKKAIVIGAGFAGLSAATHLATAGFQVTLLEKNPGPGGRARVFREQGFVFDMGPSWYWMPDIFEQYFAQFGKSVADYYQLVRLDPSYNVVFGPGDFVDIPAQFEQLCALFEGYEAGSSERLKQFLNQAAYKYKVGINEFVHKPSLSLTEFLDLRLVVEAFRLDLFQSFHGHIRKFFKDDKLIRLMEFPVLFLGAIPQNTPALYSLMNYADMVLGTWYPLGGMHKIVEGMVQLAQEKGVDVRLGQAVQQIMVQGRRAVGVQTAQGTLPADVVVAGADYHHVETHLLGQPHRSYSDDYWNKRVMAPSCLLYYVGVNKRLRNLRHHNLFFDRDLQHHAVQIYEKPQWPTEPLFYASVPSITDPSVAPPGHENLFLLVPVAPGLADTEALREKYYHIIMERMETLTGQSIRDAVVYKRSYAHRDFVDDYHAFKGNAYGLANTLRQTAILKPSLKSRKVDNLFYTGQLTVPGPGVPPSLISGGVVARQVQKEIKA